MASLGLFRPESRLLRPEQKQSVLLERLKGFESVLVAFSGGLDSSYLLRMAVSALGEKAVAFTANSPALPRHEMDLTRKVAREIGARHIIADSLELEDSRYTENPTNRCFFCKSTMYSLAMKWSQDLGFKVVADGTNLDDLSDHRPGLDAAKKWGVTSPLADVGFSKEEIRSLSRGLKLSVWSKPASPCLASRIPYGVEVTPERLMKIEKAESVIRGLGFVEFRVRYHGDVARIEVSSHEMSRMLEPRIRKEVVSKVQGLGFRFVSLDLAGFRSGSLNTFSLDE